MSLPISAATTGFASDRAPASGGHRAGAGPQQRGSTAGWTRLRVQHLLAASADIELLRLALHTVGRPLGWLLELAPDDGEIVLLDAELTSVMSESLIAAFCEGRPTLQIGRPPAGPWVLPDLCRQLHGQCMQLMALGALGPTQATDAASAAADGGFDALPEAPFDTPLQKAPRHAQTRLQRESQLLRSLQRRRLDPMAAPLALSYGPRAHLWLDFRARLAQGDERSLQALRGQRGLPCQVPGDPSPRPASALPLDQAVWNLGIAAAPLPLLDAPAAWWDAPLIGPEAMSACAHTRVPSHLDILRRLAQAPVTPQDLRRQTRISAPELRSVLQACLLLDLARWGQVQALATASENHP